MGIEIIPIFQSLTKEGAGGPLPYKTGETMFGFVLSILTQRRAESQEETLKWQPTDSYCLSLLGLKSSNA